MKIKMMTILKNLSNMAFHPKGIIVHSMGEYIRTTDGVKYAKDFLTDIGLSVHGFIKPNGDYDRMKYSSQKAYHAGVSQHMEYVNLNSWYLGFEILVEGVHNYSTFTKAIKHSDAYTDAQIDTTISVIQFWIDHYSIPLDRVVRHSDVSGDDIRGEGKGKIDPGSGLNWDYITSNLCGPSK
jgi:N-acetyl-anhydromuramyl-L-alanine amidase AmpD